MPVVIGNSTEARIAADWITAGSVGELFTPSTAIHHNSQKEKEAKRKRTGRLRLSSVLLQTTTTRHITKHATLNVESPAIAVVERNVEYLKKIVIPAGTQVIGTVAIQQDHDRILVNFHTLVFPEGDEVKFGGMALSLDGSAGIKGKVETHKDSAVANTVLRSFVSGSAQALSMTGVSPIAAQAAQGLSGEAARELDAQRQQVVNTSISVDADTGLRVYNPQRMEY